MHSVPTLDCTAALMHLTVVLGAGASVAQASALRPVNSGSWPPLDTSFFERAQARRRTSALLRDVSAAATHFGLPDPFVGDERPRMEEFFGDLYYEVQDQPNERDTPGIVGYRALLRLYATTLAETTNWMSDRRRGPMRKLIESALARSDITELTLITFNHDLILENALTMLRGPRRWCVEHGYGRVALHYRPPRTDEVLPLHDEDCDHSIPIKLLKLHGSLNWQVMTAIEEPALNELFPPQSPSEEMSCYLDREVSVRLRRRQRGSDTSFRLWPQLVPPIYEKQRILERFKDLWAEAREALKRSDWVCMFGYSLPPTDTHTQMMIRRSISSNSDLRRLDVVNPNPAIASRIAEVSSAPQLSWHKELSHFLEAVNNAGSL